MSDREALWTSNRHEFVKRYIRQEYGVEPAARRRGRAPAELAVGRLADVLETIRRRRLGGVDAVASIIRSYKDGAVNRDLQFELSDEEAAEMIRAACGYCGFLERSRYNGIDRIDNTIGYISDNCIACCQWCNYAKGRRDVADFLKWLQWVSRRAPGAAR
jgi:hypothetical protein